ncbi:PF06532 family protein [Leptospira weilii serovar Topaz str. LT2116]|uniref:PF06532 family protein n=1 Tax=Leptospira weilii serovar Topaz str. LT2116 TaxID=1088540 RepID=M3GDM9_9LEPT|nr:PF06532 family protein [Leptospira weilii serovar Topaz str. LT2116]
MSYQEQTTESLIRKMAKEPPIRKNGWNWFVILGAVVLTSLFLLYLHPTSNRFIHLPTLLPDFFWISLIALYSFWTLSRLRFPEESFTKTARFPLLLAFLWILYSICMFVWDLIGGNEIHIHIGRCWIILSLSSALLAGSGVLILKNGNPGNPVLAAAVLSVFNLALANFYLKFICDNQSSFHILVSHVFTSLLLFLFGFLVFKNILKW